MNPTPPTLPRAHRLYGWYILAASFVILFFNSGARLSFGVIFKPMLADFGWDRGDLSAAFLLNMLVYALSLVVVGRFYDRYGPRWVIIISTVFLSAGYILTAFVQAMWQFLLCYGVLAAIGLGGTSVPLIASLMSKWFQQRRGLAVSLALCGNSLGQFVLVPLFTRFIVAYDWRTSYLTIGAIMLIVNLALALLIIRGDPDQLGYPPVGAETPNPENPLATAAPPGDLRLRDALRTSPLWLFIGAMFICGGQDFLVATHLIPLVTDHGIAAEVGGQMLAWYGLMSLVGLLVTGPVSDRMGNKIPISLTFLIRFVLFVLVLRSQSVVSFYIFALAYGFTHLITAPLTPILVGKLYGLSHVGVIAGLVTTVHHLSGGLWVYGGGVIFDRTGSYRIAFILAAILSLVALVCSVFLNENRYSRPGGPE